jgi:hypothetical protein
MLIYIIYITFRDIWMTIYTITMVWDIHSLDIPVIWDHHLGFLYIIHITFRDIYIYIPYAPWCWYIYLHLGDFLGKCW